MNSILTVGDCGSVKENVVKLELKFAAGEAEAEVERP